MMHEEDNMKILINELREYKGTKNEVATVFGTGNLTADIECRTVNVGDKTNTVAGGKNADGKVPSIALNYREGGEKKTDFYRIEAWGKTAELLGRFGKKGTHMTVHGRYKEEPYTNKDGKEVISKILVVESFELSPRLKGENTAEGSTDTAPVADTGFSPVDDEDLPF